MKFKYSLEKGTKKHICPNCNKKTFVRYMDNQLQQYLASSFGRCDRESNCKYHVKPKQKTIIAINSNNCNSNFKHSTFKSTYDYHKNIDLETSLRDLTNNNLVIYLKSNFSSFDINNVMRSYKIGTSQYWKNSTVFLASGQ